MKLKWYLRNRNTCESNAKNVLESVLSLGSWLRDKEYIGKDVKITNPETEIITVYSLGLMGWITLHQLYGKEEYLTEIEHCLKRMLRCWNHLVN